MAPLMLCLWHCAARQTIIIPESAFAGVCPKSKTTLPVRVTWETQWRANQKDKPAREQAIERGLEKYFAHSRCFRALSIQRAAERPLNQESKVLQPGTISILVSELGPKLQILGSLWLLEGGTEVSFTIGLKSADPQDAVKSATVHSRHTGPWYIKGVKSLDEELATALRMAFEGPEPAG